MRKTLLLLALLGLTPALDCFCQSLTTLLIPGDAQSLSLGGAEAVSLWDVGRLSGAVSYGMWSPSVSDVDVIAADVSFRLKDKFVINVEFSDYLQQEYERATNAGNVKGTYTPSDMLLGAGFAYSINDRFTAGVKCRYVKSSLAAVAESSTMGADVSLAYRNAGYSAVLSVENLGPQISYGTSSYSQPMMVRAGGSYGLGGLTAVAELDCLLEPSAVMAAVGAEYSIKDIFALRAGYHYGPADKALPTFFSLGAGAGFKAVHLNAAYLLASDTLAGTMLLGLSITL